MENFSFKGITKPYITKIRKRKPYWAPKRRRLLVVPGMPGAHLRGTEIDSIIIPVDIWIKADSPSDLENKADDLVEWLDSEDSESLVFESQPNRTYFAVVDGELDPYEIANNAFLTVYFLCSDPYSYGPERTHQLSSQVGTIITVEGTAETKPIFELDVTAPITYAMIQNHLNEYMMIGQPIDVESQVPFQKYERILYDDATSKIGWSDASSSDIDGGVVTGNIIAQNGRFIAESYGTGTSWHGPAIKRGLDDPLKDFRVEVELDFFNNRIQHVGRVEVYLLDILGNQVAKLALKDTKSGSMDAVGEIKAGSHFLVDSKNSNSWNDFNGVLRIEREGNVWKAYVGRIKDGKHTGRLNVEWTDREGLYTANVAQVVVHMAQIGDYEVPDQGVKIIITDKINQEPEGVPYIAGPGDKITFNFLTRELLINGENRKDLKTDLGGRYFTFKPGQNTIALSPNAITGISKYRPAYK